ncbi:uncharacterized protein Pyn_29109 [Prunus yedoensis var. nudiflora]|uniref:Uncharacterized protein n=1 Tax=Prunus yedoensis var. nudiflora TaxID=2094558 RepID=A0A314YH41_PRUYE|nr:uncharacterized protein Pyn_29109 [Prunus yedoensis var. nudiflora]
MQALVYFLVVVGWILVAGTFILCGVFLLLHNVVADACVSMDEWVQNPTAHTALDDILPAALVKRSCKCHRGMEEVCCEVSSAGICTTPGRLTPNFYSQMEAAVNVSYGLYRYGPFLVDLQDCTFVRDAFTNVSNRIALVCESTVAGSTLGW